MRSNSILALIIVISILGCTVSRADSFGVNIYGLSYHTGDNVANRDIFNEVNKGIGFRADFGSQSGNSFFVEGGKYNDSFNNDAKYISIAYQIRIWNQLRAGLNAALYNTKSTNRGETFFAPIPIASFREWRITINTVYLPEHEPINPFTVYGAYLTFVLVQDDQ